MKKSYHMIIFGAGSGGLVCAAGAAALGAKIALIEKNRMGGDCLNTGCVPSKAIIRSAKLAYDTRRAGEFGLAAQLSDPRLDQVMESVRRVQAKIAPHDSKERFTSLGVDVYRGDFHFISPNEISNGAETLSASRFVIATGSSPAVPNLEGLNQVEYLTSENIWDLQELPRHLVILGGGPIGCELAQVFARLGSQVQIVQRAEQLLHREDHEIGQQVREFFLKEGIQTHLHAEAKSIVRTQTGYALKILQKKKGEIFIPFDRLCIAVGRRPNLAGLELSQAGVETGSKGIQVDEYLRTSAKHIYACGDVTGPFLFTHTADHQARTVLRNALFPGKSKINYRVVPWSTFTDPEVARVGLNERDAQKRGIPYDCYSYPMAKLDRGICDRETEGLIKVLTKKGKDEILGVTLVSVHGGDLLSEWVLAMNQGIGMKKLAKGIHIYPTLSEINKRVVDQFQSARLSRRTKGWLGRYFRWRFE